MFYSAEQQRNQALQNAERLKEAFKDYKTTMSAKYQKVKLLILWLLYIYVFIIIIINNDNINICMYTYMFLNNF